MLRQMNRKMKEKGFTLIELMIVVAIIGILAAIAIPNFRNYQLKAKRGELPTNLKAIKTAEVAYQAETDGFQALTASPRAATAAACNASKRSWTDNGGFDTIGWQPSGDVYGAYASIVAGGSNITAEAVSDIDDDATLANYTFTVNIANASKDEDVTMKSNANDF